MTDISNIHLLDKTATNRILLKDSIHPTGPITPEEASIFDAKSLHYLADFPHHEWTQTPP